MAATPEMLTSSRHTIRPLGDAAIFRVKFQPGRNGRRALSLAVEVWPHYELQTNSPIVKVRALALERSIRLLKATARARKRTTSKRLKSATSSRAVRHIRSDLMDLFRSSS